MSSIEVQFSTEGIRVFPDQIYPEELYRAAEVGCTPRKQKTSMECTNVIMQILEKYVYGILSDPDLIQRVKKHKGNAEIIKRIEGVFHTIKFTPSKNVAHLEGDRKDLALRTANLFRFVPELQLETLKVYLCHSRNFSEEEAFRSILGAFDDSLGDAGGSLSDAVGERVLDVFRVNLAVQKARSVDAKAEITTAKEELARERLKMEAYDGLLNMVDKVKRGYHFPKGYQVRR